MERFAPTDPVELDPEGPLPRFEFQFARAAVERGIQRGKQVVEASTINLWVGLHQGPAPLGQGRMEGQAEHLVAPAQQALPQSVGIPCRLKVFFEVVGFMRDCPRVREVCADSLNELSLSTKPAREPAAQRGGMPPRGHRPPLRAQG